MNASRRFFGVLPAVARWTAALVVACGVVASEAASQGQPKPSTVVGRIADRSSGKPVASAEVVNGTDSRATTTDSVGRFTLGGLVAGKSRLVIRAQGFPLTTFVVDLPAGDTLIQVIQLDSTAEGRSRAQQLPQVSVKGQQSLGPRYADFERRLKTGRGQYLTADDIDKNRYNSLQEAVRTMRGVEVSCGGGDGCYIKMARAPMQCVPEYVVDDRVDNMFGPRTPIRDIQGIEVYNGPSDVPGEYAGRNAGCGVVVIWTKSGPPPPRRKP